MMTLLRIPVEGHLTLSPQSVPVVHAQSRCGEWDFRSNHADAPRRRFVAAPSRNCVAHNV